jgi:outer membrane protein assembly factor BamA
MDRRGNSFSEEGIRHAAEKGTPCHEGDEMMRQIEVREFSTRPARRRRLRTAASIIRLVLAATVLLPLWGQDQAENPPRPSDKSEFIGFPAVYRTPETRWAGGAAAQWSFFIGKSTPQTRPSSIQFSGYYTQNKQVIFTAKPEVYFGDEGFITSGNLEISRYPGYFYGIGPDTPASSKEAYTPVQTILDEQALLRIVPGKRVHLGLDLIYEHYSFRSFTSGGQLVGGNILGSAGGTVSGIGPAFRWDTRDNIFYAHSGRFWQVNFVLCGPWMGSAYEFNRTKVDLREFIPLFQNHTLALQAEFWAVSGGNVPFMDLPILGGDHLLRGYYKGRFRDKDLTLLQAEYRIPVWWRFDAVAFVGVGQVADTVSGLDFKSLHAAAGAGLRFRISRRGTMIRVDIGWGKDGSALYLTAGEAY